MHGWRTCRKGEIEAWVDPELAWVGGGVDENRGLSYATMALGEECEKKVLN